MVNVELLYSNGYVAAAFERLMQNYLVAKIDFVVPKIENLSPVKNQLNQKLPSK